MSNTYNLNHSHYHHHNHPYHQWNLNGTTKGVFALANCAPLDLFGLKLGVVLLTMLGVGVNIVGVVAYKKLRTDGDSTFQLALQLLSTTESLLCFLVGLLSLWDVMYLCRVANTREKVITEVYDFFTISTFNFIGLRNWWLVLLTLHRAVATLLPLRSRSLINKRRILCLYALGHVSWLATALAIHFMKACNRVRLAHASLIFLLPGICIALLTCVIVGKLCRRKFHNPVLYRASATASKIMTLYAITFLVFQCPFSITVYFLKLRYGETAHSHENFSILAQLLINDAVSLDCVINFFILLVFSKPFRTAVKSTYINR